MEWYHSQWPWVTFDPHFKVMKFFEDEYRKNIKIIICLKDKVTIAQ